MAVTQPRRKAQGGLSLVEIMVALVAGLLVIASVGQIFVSSKQSSRSEDQLSRLQENARLAMSLLTHDLRLVGNTGCVARLTNEQLKIFANPPLLSPITENPITGGNNTGTNSYTHPSPAISTAVGAGRTLANVVNGTDAITIQFAEPVMAPCRGNLQAALATVNPNLAIYPGGAPDNCAQPVGQPVLVSDCATAHIFRVADDISQNTDPQGAVTNVLNKTYNPDGSSELRLFRAYTYYIRLNDNNPPQPALYRLDNNSPLGDTNPVELVEGIEDLQILYGVDGSGDGAADQYLTAPQIVAPITWDQVVSLRIDLTARTLEDHIAKEKRHYAGTNTDDYRLVYDSVTTVGLRNRLQ